MIDFICKSDINSSDSAVDYQEAEVVIDSEYEENESPIRVYLSYFQLKFHVTDRGMQLFLSFMDVLIALISTGKKKRVESLYDFQMICHLYYVTEFLHSGTGM